MSKCTGSKVNQLWKVSIETEIVVRANTQEQAEKVAKRNIKDIVSNEDLDYYATPVRRGVRGPRLPTGWTTNTVPYGAELNTIKEFLEEPDKE